MNYLKLIRSSFKLILISSTLFFSACASKPVAVFPVPVETPPAEIVTSQSYSEPKIDYDGLHSYLKMDRPAERLGYVEKAFPTCEVGYGYYSNRNCRRDYFVSIHFQLMCRDSNEDSYTEALTAADMQPLKGRTVNWSLNKAGGTVTLDNSGHGQIKTTARNTQKSGRLKLNIDNDNLYVKAGEINKIVTPSNWCN